MRPPAFGYTAPTTVHEIVALLKEHGADARVMAGGQSLVPLMNLRMIRPALLIDLNRCPELGQIERRGQELVFGAMVRQLDAARSPLVQEHCPLVAQALELAGPVAVRARSTVGGTLAHADRVAELGAVAVALEATLVIESTSGRREVGASAFFLGDLSTVIEPHEFLREVRFPVSGSASFSSFAEASVRREGVAVVGLAVQLQRQGLQLRQAALVAMGVESTPVRLRRAEALLLQRGLGSGAIKEVAAIAAGEVAPMPDIYASAAYRRHVIGALLDKALHSAAGRTDHA